MNFLYSQFASELEHLEERALRRRLRVVESAHEPYVRVDGCQMLMLASNNYLGLASHPQLKRAEMLRAEYAFRLLHVTE